MVRGLWGKIPENPCGDGAGKGDHLELGDFLGKIPEKNCISGRDEGRILGDFPLSSLAWLDVFILVRTVLFKCEYNFTNGLR